MYIADAGSALVGGKMTIQIEPGENTYQKLNKLLPADATGAFLSIQALIAQFKVSLDPDKAASVAAISTAVVIVVIMIILPFYARYYLGILNKLQILFLIITFLVWSIYLSQGPLTNLLVNYGVSGDYFGLIASITMIIWTLVISPAISHILK